MNVSVGVMARAPIPGQCKARLLAVYDPAWVAALYGAMLGDTLDALARLGPATKTVFLAPGRDGDEAVLAPLVPAGWGIQLQRGDDLGARIEHALGAMFATGARCAVISGSDAPLVNVDGVLDALSRIGDRGDEVVLAPCDDGGYSLLALTRPAPRLFEAMPWSTSAVLATTRDRALESGLRVTELPAGFDVDEPADVLRLAEVLRAAPSHAPRTAHVLKELRHRRS